MIAIQFLAEWALRSSILILSGAALLRVLRVKDSYDSPGGVDRHALWLSRDPGSHGVAAEHAVNYSARHPAPGAVPEGDLRDPIELARPHKSQVPQSAPLPFPDASIGPPPHLQSTRWSPPCFCSGCALGSP